MALKCCRFCEAPLADGDNAGRPGEFCSDEHRREYLDQIQRETVERLKRSEVATLTHYQTVLQAGPPPGLMHTPALRGNLRDAHLHRDPNGERGTQTSFVLETAKAPLVNGSVAADLAAASEAAAHPPTTSDAIGHIEKTDNASLSNLLREARDRIANDPAPTTTALAIRRKSRPVSKRPMPPNGASNGTHVPEAAEAAQAVPVRPVVDLAIEPPQITVPLRPEAQPSIGVVSSPTAQPDYPSQNNTLAKPSSEACIEIAPPTLAMPTATLMERIPWYVVLVLVLGIAGAGGYYWSTTQALAAKPAARPVMDEVKPLSMAITEWETVNATGEDSFMSGRTLTLHKSSMELTDYRVEFVGMVDYRALGWAVRIQDPGNYYAAKLRRNPSGKARLSFVRWKVENGVAGPEAILPLEMRLPSNEQYTVKIDVRGDQIVTSLQGKVIDRWSDDTFSKGGFGYSNQNTELGKVVVTTIGILNKPKTP